MSGRASDDMRPGRCKRRTTAGALSRASDSTRSAGSVSLLAAVDPQAEARLARRGYPAGMQRDLLFVLRPGFTDRGARWFCPYSAQVVGFLSYYPHVRDTLELCELEFPRPHQAMVELVGEEHQAAPLLVLAAGAAPPAIEDVTIGEAKGRFFVEKTIEILRYLAATRGLPGPH